VNRSNENLVLFTLAIANAPLTIGDLAFRSNKSYNTVKKIVETDERVVKTGSYPNTYYMKLPSILNQTVIRFEHDEPPMGWVKWLKKVDPVIRSLIAIDKTAKPDDLYKQAVVIEAMAINLVAFARQLKDNASKPDWFTLMGGKEDDDA
jgi:hypothetical protein